MASAITLAIVLTIATAILPSVSSTYIPAYKCSPAESPQYGSVTIKGHYAYYRCDKGYQLYGDQYITCQHGKWIGNIPTCKPIKCPDLHPPKYGDVVVKGYTHGSKAQYSCNKGYKLYGEEYNNCIYGRWIKSTPICKPILCPYLQVPQYAIVRVEGYTNGSKARYSCAHGYTLYGEDYATCIYGKWVGVVPICKAIKCPEPTVPSYASVDVKGYTNGYKAHFSCNYGYKLYGNQYTTCVYGVWKGDLPQCKPILCPRLRAPRYGLVDVNDYSNGSKAQYSCNKGYNLYGNSYVTCVYGKWIGVTPICKPIPCPKLVAPTYGSVNVKGYGHKSRAVYSCDHGYKLYGAAYITCDYGVWKGTPPVCKANNCRKPVAPKYGSVDVKGYSHGSKAIYSCKHGYELYGNEEITCEYGLWKGKVAICKAIPCPKLTLPAYGSVVVKGYNHGSRAVYSCNHGYELYGDERITCDYGVWKGKIPICKPIPCPMLVKPKYGSINVNSYSHNSRAVYSCDHGYKLYGDEYIICDYGIWKGKIPICKPIPCPKLVAPTYGSVDVKGYSHSSRAVYSCEHGYQLYGDESITCNYGIWQGKIPICKPIPCPKLVAPAYGSVDVKGYSHTSRAEYSCNHGYKLYGDEYITCNYGVWKGKIPICKPIPCPNLVAPTYGSVDVQGYTHSSRAVYACNHGYKLYGDEYITCNYGVWKGKIPICKPIPCPKLVAPTYGSVDVKGYSHSSRAVYSCNHGYKLYGDEHITCDYGVWKGKIPICKPIPCPKLVAPTYGSVDVKGYSHSSRAVYSCNHGYKLYGDEHITCDYGVWKGKIPICKPIPCPKLVAPTYGSVDVKGYSHSSRAVYSCNHGYKLYGDEHITCDYGVWKGKIPICKPIPCPKLVAPTYGSVDVKGYSHSSRAVYSCNHGYKLYGDEYITCDYGVWKGKIPICKPIPCPNLVAPTYGSVDVRGYTHSSKAVYACNHGYILYGDEYITCNYGVWKGKIPICKPIPCPKLVAPTYGSVDVKGYSHNSKAVYACDHGYKLYGDEYITCDYGVWKGKIPICKPIPCPKLVAPTYGSIDVKGYSHSSRAVYSCDHGYKLYGDEYITCDYGVWIGKIPVCQRIVKKRCPYPRPPHYGSVKVTGWNTTPEAWYLCSSGYYLYGQESRRCENGKWLGEAPVCKKLHY